MTTTTTVATAFEDLTSLVASATHLNFIVPQRTIEGVVAMDAQIERLAQDGAGMNPEEVIASSAEIVRICTALSTGLAVLVQPAALQRVESSMRAVSQLETRSALARTRFSSELASLKLLSAEFAEMIVDLKAEELSSLDFVIEAVESIVVFNGEMKEFESAMAAFKRKGAEIRAKQEEKDRQAQLAKQVSVHNILAQLGRPSQVAPKAGRSGEKREADRKIRNDMKGNAGGGKKGNRQMANA